MFVFNFNFNFKKAVNSKFRQSMCSKSFSDAIKTVGVVGSGQMGTGIAYVFGR
jgi:hypothetical protein